MRTQEERTRMVWTITGVFALAFVLYQWAHTWNEKAAVEANLSSEVQRWKGQAESASSEYQKLLEGEKLRTKLFRTMSGGCARYVNTVEAEAFRESRAIQMVISGEWTAADLVRWGEDEAMGAGYYDHSKDEDRAICGMRRQHPGEVNKPDYVEPISDAWVHGSEAANGVLES